MFKISSPSWKYQSTWNSHWICFKFEQVNINNNEIHESINNNDLNNEDESIFGKEDSKSEVEEDDSKAEANVLQDKISAHYLDNHNVDSTPFLSSYIKLTSKK